MKFRSYYPCRRWLRPLAIFPFLALVMWRVATPKTEDAPVVKELARCCMTDSGEYIEQTPDLIRQRFKLYQDLGVNMVRASLDWRLMEFTENNRSDPRALPYLRLAAQSGLRIKLTVGTISAPAGWYLKQHPDALITNQNGSHSFNTMSLWYPDLHAILDQQVAHVFEYLSQHPEVLNNVDYIVPDFGPASEAIYPAAWTMGPDYTQGETFWFYDVNAQLDFAQKMQAKYHDIANANAAWKTTYANWAEVKIPRPGVQPGPFWADVITWYRDSKREFVVWQIHNFKTAITKYLKKPVHLIMYVPGVDYTEADWDQAVATGAGGPSISLMCDSKFLIQTAAKEHCWLQYTGCENEAEVKHLRGYMDQNGFGNVPLSGENAGIATSASDPLHLADVVLNYGLWGLDYTFSSFVFENDTITPNALFPQLKQAYAKINKNDRVQEP